MIARGMMALRSLELDLTAKPTSIQEGLIIEF